MRPIRNVDQVGGGSLMENYSLEDIKQLWNDWEIQALILLSFGLQVFLFLAADVRRHSTSHIPNALLWLGYMTADAVAVFALGHLAVAASTPGHQLLLFWAPFVLLHLGGQDTIIAFAMQDNELWRRHLLALVTEATVAIYVVTRSSWPDRQLLLVAMVLMFLCGLVKYAERTWCLFSARPAGLSKNSLVSLDIYVRMAGSGRTILGPEGKDPEDELKLRIDMMLGKRPSALAPYTNMTLVSDALANDLNAIAGADALPEMLKGLKSDPDNLRAYRHVATLLSSCYDKLYTKGGLRGYWIGEFKKSLKYIHKGTQPKLGFLRSILVLLFPFLSMSASLVLFVFNDKHQLYNRVDVIVSYILLIGAIVLEVTSLVISILSHYESSSVATNKCVHHLPGHRKQWSQSLGQYNMTEAYNIKAHAETSSVPKWIHKLSGKILGDKKVTHIKITQDLMKLVLDKLLEFGSDKKCWSFASTRGQFALMEISVSKLTAMHDSVFGVDFPTSVLIWHIATDICYFRHDNQAEDSDSTKMEMARNLSNYIMYLIFQCKVMLTSNSKLVHENTMESIGDALKNKVVLTSNETIKMVHDQNKMVYNRIKVEELEDDEHPLPQDSSSAPVHEAKQGHQPANSASSSDQQATQMQLLQNNIKALCSLVLPYASAVAEELALIPGGRPWDLISAVWLEMLYYIAPRCGGDFHSEHLSTGGEFATHVMVLMHQLGPFLPPPGA